MAIIIREVAHTIAFVQNASGLNITQTPMYGSLEGADRYFANMLEGQRWEYTEPDKRRRALVTATRRIDNLPFIGEKADAGQLLQFPRGTDTLVPVQIEQAAYELAIVLLKGVDPDTEAANLYTKTQAYGGIRSEYDRSRAFPIYIQAGIPSQVAWNLLLPWIAENRAVRLNRTS
jgi:hypothetical protein